MTGTTARGLDVDRIRADFPALDSGVAFFDAPGGTQAPRAVAEAMAGALTGPLSNRGRRTPGEVRADDIVAAARSAMADLLAVPPDEVVFGRSATQLTYDLARMLAAGWGAGDEVLVSRLDHDANVRPWVQAAERAGATVRWIDVDPDTAELTADHVRAVLSDRTRLVAVTGASNLVGTRPPLAEIAAMVHGVGAHLHVDAVHLAAHVLVDRDALGADTLVCSPYKFLGPHLGVLTGRRALLESLHPDKLLPSTDAVPERFEFGTLPYEMLAGVTAAVDYLAGLAGADEVSGADGPGGAVGSDGSDGWGGTHGLSGSDGLDGGDGSGGGRRERLVASFEALERHEEALRGRLESGIATLPGVTVHSRAALRTPTLLLTFDGRDAADAYAFLADRGVAAPAGSFYAIEPSRRLGLGDAGGLRVGLAPYTSADDVERLLSGLQEFLG
ncbi:cysteine desulfurase-like protein [Nakamurella endophytica]|uniref:Cysteine desulfurase-like protein n=1 Tax=Nakamurella endophytica TaxID=1748367 RepID=A0A917WKF8_9ACTN|nr:cysteine desulfurase-like protein [Nakamurella endophytica]GGM11651.1 cysteine desulfurase-like protein [Nakamurella endophytica]